MLEKDLSLSRVTDGKNTHFHRRKCHSTPERCQPSLEPWPDAAQRRVPVPAASSGQAVNSHECPEALCVNLWVYAFPGGAHPQPSQTGVWHLPEDSEPLQQSPSSLLGRTSP